MRTPRESRRGLLIGLAAAVLVLVLYQFALLETLEGKLVDLRFRVRGHRLAPDPIVIVAIDDQSLDVLGALPWPRRYYADMVGTLREAGALVIGLDLVELTYPPGESEDQGELELAEAIGAAGNVVLPLYFGRHGGLETRSDEHAAPAMERFLGRFEQEARAPAVAWFDPYLPGDALCEAAAGLGAVNVVQDLDGVTRAMPVSLAWQDRPCPSFAAELARVANGLAPGSMQVRPGTRATLDGIEIPLLPGDETYVNHYGPYLAFRYFPFSEVLAGAVPADDLAQKIVIVGKTGPEGVKRRVSVHPAMPGAELQATMTANILRGNFLTAPPAWVTVVTAVLLALLTGFLCAARGPGGAALTFVAVMAAAAVVGMLLFFGGVVVRLAEPLAATGFTGLLLTAVGAAAADRSRARAQSAIDTLTAIGRIVRSTLNRPELLRAILEWARRALEAEASSLLTLDEERNELVFEVALGEKGEEVKAFRVPVGEGVVGYVAQTGESVIVSDPSRDRRFRRDIADAVEFPVRDIICVALKVQDRIIGVLEVLNKTGGGGFTEADRELLEIIASQAAVFLENVHLYNMLEQRVDFANRELRIANRELATETNKMEAILQGMADGLVGLDTEGKIVRVNEAAEHMLSIREEDVVGRPATECFAEENVAALFADIVASDYPILSRELTVAAPQQMVLRATPAPVAGEEGVTGTVVVFSDITQLKELDRMKSELVSLASHELRSPLTAIKGFTALLAQQPQDSVPPDALQSLRIIDSQVDLMRRLIEDFLNIARIEAGRPLEMNWSLVSDLPAIVQEAVEAIKPSAPEHRFEVEAPASLGSAEADRDKLYQILSNLLSNAVKYSPRGGLVRVSLGEQDGQLSVSVKDQGVGIPEDQMPQLFQRFRRVKSGATERVTGTGLGLYLTKHLVEAHGGRIWAESQPGRGSTFSFTIPCGRDAAREGPAGAED
ncbi:MAG: CHASE2 domain-containing protein [Armatimonadota bacterium]